MSVDAFHPVIIADDHVIVRAGLRAALESPALFPDCPIKVVDEVGNGIDAIAAVKRHKPRLLLLDVSMPMAGGVEVLVETRRWCPDTRVVVFTGITAQAKISELIETGVDGLFSKSTSNEEMYARIPGILNGQRYIAAFFDAILEEKPKQSSLTDRERQVLNLIVSGRSNREIAEYLVISVKTVDRHRTSLMRKLDVHSVAQLIAYALREGLIGPAMEM
jgi:DNA-binding NarL/FixJ family response regulator